MEDPRLKHIALTVSLVRQDWAQDLVSVEVPYGGNETEMVAALQALVPILYRNAWADRELAAVQRENARREKGADLVSELEGDQANG